MKTLFTKNIGMYILMLSVSMFAVYAICTSVAFAQATPTTIGLVAQYTGKELIEKPSVAPFTNSTCPNGSIMVGFNLDNIGDNYSYYGSLYCRPNNITGMGTVTQYSGKFLIENPSASVSPYTNLTCPSGSIMVGFNLDNMGSEYGNYGSLYCRTVSSINLGNVTRYHNNASGYDVGKTLAEASAVSPYIEQTCPDGSALVGFNLDDQGGSATPYGSLYCRSIQASTDYSLSATNMGSLHRSADGASTVSANLTQPVAITSVMNGSCKVIYDREDPKHPLFEEIDCISNHPLYPSDVSYQNNLTQFRTAYANKVCGSSNWTASGSLFSCNSPITYSPTIIQSVNLAVSQLINSGGVNVLGNTDGTGVSFVSFSQPSIKPTANSILTLHTDSATPYGLYTGTVISNVANNDVSMRHSADFTLSVEPGGIQPPTGVTAVPGACATNPNEVAVSWSAPSAVTGYLLTGYKVYRDSASIYTTPGTTTVMYTDTSATPGLHTYGVSAVYLYESPPGTFVGVESATTTATETSPNCAGSCIGSKPAAATACPGDETGFSGSVSWSYVGENTGSCTPSTKCEYYVMPAGGGSCNISGISTANASFCYDPPASGTKNATVTTSCHNFAGYECEYYCDSGYHPNDAGTACVPNITASVSCSPYRANGTLITNNQRVNVGSTVTWKASPVGQYNYHWHDNVGNGDTIFANSDWSVTYTTQGVKNAGVELFQGIGSIGSADCDYTVNVSKSSIQEI